MLSKRVSTIEYAIRDLVVEAQKVEKLGKKVLYANIGDPLKYDFAPPHQMIEALHSAVHAGHNYYGDSQGDLEFRQAIAERENRVAHANITADDVIVTAGVSEAIFFLTAALIEKGDQALLAGPGYPPYISYTKFFGGEPVFYRTIEENGWQPDIRDMEKKITEKTKFLLIINPNNPTGAIYDRSTLKEIVNLAAQHKLTLVSDEVYDLLAFDKKFHSMASLIGDVPMIGFNGLSKGYMATGWRTGWTYFVNADERMKEIKEGMMKQARIRLCTSMPFQKAAIPLLRGNDRHLENEMKRLKERRDLSFKRLNEIPGISATKPEAAFYIFPKIADEAVRKGGWKTDKEFVLDLLHTKQVLTVNGSGFGGYGDGHFRVVFLPTLETLEEIYNRIEDFMRLRMK